MSANVNTTKQENNMFKFGPLQTKWLKLLESGRYTQAEGALCRVNPNTGKVVGFCCLGIAEAGVMKRKPRVPRSELANAAKWNSSGGFDDTIIDVYFGKESSELTVGTQRKMKFRDQSGGAAGGGYLSLAFMNDDGKTFKQIAAAVRNSPENFFTGPA